MLFTLRYRRQVAGVTTGLIEARSLELAERVGKAFCAKDGGRKFVSVEAAVVADESILGELAPAGPPPTPPAEKPTLTEQQARHQEAHQVANASGNIAPALRSEDPEADQAQSAAPQTAAAPATPSARSKPSGRVGA